jgi:hypothetical protein
MAQSVVRRKVDKSTRARIGEQSLGTGAVL